MPSACEKPDFSRIYESANDFPLSPDSAYVVGCSEEERESWLRGHKDLKLVDILVQTRSGLKVRYSDGTVDEVALRSTAAIERFWSKVDSRKICLDITSLGHHVWAPLLRTAINLCLDVIVLYAEPNDYKKSLSPTEGTIFDLSISIEGIAPIPGFASLSDEYERHEVFIPLLGFEGNRLAHLIEHVQPAREKIIPIVGVPGFRPEFVFHAYHGNCVSLLDTEAWKSMRFAAANSPFALCYLLEDIARERPNDLLKIAPIGTKPHALGAFLFYLKARRQVEFIYDFPIRRPKRTQGIARVLAYDVTKFLSLSRL